MAKEKKVTFADIAKYTGFSKTTVSRFFNDRDSLTLENQQKIQDALDVLGYQENKLAKVLANGKSEFIGIIIPNLYLNYYAEMLELLLSCYDQYGYKFLIFRANSKEEVERAYIRELQAYKIEGLIVLSHTIPSKELASFQIPTVAIEREASEICSVCVDNREGGKLAANRLMADGCDDLIQVNAFFPESSPAFGRITGFNEACRSQGRKPVLIQAEFFDTYESIREKLAEVFEQIEKEYPKDHIKGVFLANDTYASIFVNLILRKYKEFPDTYKVIGFDNTRAAQECAIPLTTIAQPMEEMANQAMELLNRQMEMKKKRIPETLEKPIHIEVVPSLVIRETA